MTGRRPQVVAAGGLALASLLAVDPFGWDHVGPIRWFLVPTLGFALVALVAAGLGLRPAPGQAPMVRLARLVWLAFLAWAGLAAALGADPLHAWIGTPDRRFGWLTWLLCGGLFLAGTRLDDGVQRATVRAMTIGALGLGLLTLAEWAGMTGPLGLDGEFDGDRLGGPLGQPAYLGAAATLAVPTAVGTALETDASTRWRVVGAAGAVAATAALLLSQSRAAWLGLAVATVLVVLVLGRRPAERATRAAARTTLVPAVPLLVVAATVAVVPSLRNRILDGWGDGGVIDGRLAEWRVGLRALGASPLVGHGPEGYRTVFGAHVDEGYVIDWGRAVITDRVHSGPLDVAVTVGGPGALLYAVLVAAVVIAALRVAGRGRSGGSRATAGAAAGVVAYAAGRLFLFPLVELDPLFWLLAGGVVAGAGSSPDPGLRRSPGPDPEEAAGHPTLRSLVVGLAAGLAVVSGLAGLADLGANLDVAAAVDGAAEGTAEGAVDGAAERTVEGGADGLTPGSDPDREPGPDADLDTALTLRPDSIRYRFLASRLASRRGDLDAAIDHVEVGLQRSPSDPALRGEQAALLLAVARAEGDEPARSQALEAAVDELREVVGTDPLHPRHLQNLGIALALSGQLDEARTVLERAVELAPDDPAAAANLATVIDLSGG